MHSIIFPRSNNNNNIQKTYRLYTKGTVLGYKRSLRSQDPNTSLLKIEGVNDKKDTDFYLGKRVAYVYRAHKKREAKGKRPASKIRCIWGKVTRPHGNSGVVRAKFRHNLPPKCFGATVRVVSNPKLLLHIFYLLHRKFYLYTVKC